MKGEGYKRDLKQEQRSVGPCQRSCEDCPRCEGEHADLLGGDTRSSEGRWGEENGAQSWGTYRLCSSLDNRLPAAGEVNGFVCSTMVTSPWLIIYTRSSWHGVICCLQIGQWPDSRVPLITLIQYKCALLQGTTFVRRAAKQSTWLSLGRSCLAVSHSLGSSYSFQKKKKNKPPKSFCLF